MRSSRDNMIARVCVCVCENAGNGGCGCEKLEATLEEMVRKHIIYGVSTHFLIGYIFNKLFMMIFANRTYNPDLFQVEFNLQTHLKLI